MILFLLLAALSFLVAHLWGKRREDDFWYADDFFSAIMVMFFVTGIPFAIFQLGHYGSAHKVENVTYDIKLASLADNSQLNGRIRGGMFAVRGTINEVEYFSFYKANGDGSYSLDKKEADRSVVFPDATPETAYVRITDEITTCKQEAKWYNLGGCDSTSGIYVRGEFHVPEGSIANDFALDAQ